jgi:hypothetical protein
MPEFSLRELVFQPDGDNLLGIQSFAVLLGKLLLFRCKLEEETVNKMNPVDSRYSRQTKNKTVPLKEASGRAGVQRSCMY